ncbi:MAG: hypothetical protein WBL61_16420 [Bryobacteraceae bacterium]
MSGCPVCRAGFRGAAVCPRCGADLTRLMSLAVRASRSRESAREALAAQDWASARKLAGQAQRLHDTPAGRSLLAAASCLDRMNAGPGI